MYVFVYERLANGNEIRLEKEIGLMIGMGISRQRQVYVLSVFEGTIEKDKCKQNTLLDGKNDYEMEKL